MTVKTKILHFFNWLSTTEMFAIPSKQFPGNWILSEYYYEPENELIHVSEEKVKSENIFWNLEIQPSNIFTHKTNLNIPLILKIDSGIWSISKNFVSFIHPDDFRNNVEFQFAIEKGRLKLLKKDALGKIEFFGFFQKVTVSGKK